MELQEALVTRRTCHVWLDDPVPEDVVERALKAAHLAPCHRFTWPWRFVRVGPKGREELFGLALRLKSGGEEVSEALLRKVTRKVKNPAHLVAVTQVLAESPEIQREDYAAIACAIQNIALSVHGDGYGSKWGTGGLTKGEETYRILQVDRAKEEIVGFVWIGVPDSPPRQAPRRTPLEEHVRVTP